MEGDVDAPDIIQYLQLCSAPEHYIGPVTDILLPTLSDNQENMFVQCYLCKIFDWRAEKRSQSFCVQFSGFFHVICKKSFYCREQLATQNSQIAVYVESASKKEKYDHREQKGKM